MTITITFRHVEPSDLIKEYAAEKLTKLQRFLRQPMSARVTVSLEKLVHAVEVRLSSGSEHYEACGESEDMYASIDLVAHKLERQINGTKGHEQSRQRRTAESLRDGGEAEAGA
jgi:putative sigma-54 modulation protein